MKDTGLFSEGSKVLRIAHKHAKECEPFRKALQNIEAEAPTSPEPDASTATTTTTTRPAKRGNVIDGIYNKED